MKLSQIPPKLRVALQLSVSGALLVALFSQFDWSRGISLIRDADLRWVGAVFCIHIAGRLLMAFKWHQLLVVIGGHLTRWKAVRVYYESSFVGFALPLGGLGPDIVRFWRLRTYGIDSHVTLASMVMERLIGLVASLTLVVVSLVVLARLVVEPALRDFAVASAFAVSCAAAVAAVLIFHRASTRTAVRTFRLTALTVRLKIDKYHEATRAYADRRPVLVVNLALSLLEQMMPVLAYWSGSRALGIPLPFLVCLAVAPMTSIIQRLPISYAGLGMREGSAAALLVALGYDYSDALILLMTLFMMFVVSLLPGAVLSLSNGRPSGMPVAERRAG